MKAIIRLEAPEYQIGQEVSCYFKDTMSIKGICEKAEPCEDAISRQAVLEVIRKCHCEEWIKADIGAPIEALSPVTPAELEQEPCEDCVSREEVLAKKVYTETEEGWSGFTVDAKYIENLQPVQPKQKTGHWIFVDKAHEHAYCSECDYGNVDLLDGRSHNYCPNCGAKMETVDESGMCDNCEFKTNNCQEGSHFPKEVEE